MSLLDLRIGLNGYKELDISLVQAEKLFVMLILWFSCYSCLMHMFEPVLVGEEGRRGL